MSKVLTEKEANETPLPCSYNPDFVVSLSLRVSNVLYNDMKTEYENGGYSSIAEYVKQATREKINFDRQNRIDFELKQKQASE